MQYNVSNSYLPDESASLEFPQISGAANYSKENKQKYKNTKPICFNLADTQYDVV